MVYGGKPSTGCQNCRKRRIKCDETRPHCRACVRTGRTCPGYPHPFDVMLRDQVAFHRKKRDTSSRVSSPKMRVESVRSSPAPVSSSDALISTKSSADLPQTGPLLRSAQEEVPRTLVLPTDDTVTTMFFNSYIYSPRDPLILRGFMDILPDVFCYTQPGSHLHVGTLAVSYFSVAAWTGNRSFLQTAQQLFVKAIAKTREALQGDITHTVDDVLMSILLLSTYEEFCAIKENRHPRRTHLRGAVALVNSKRPEQRSSIISLILENAVQVQLIKSSKGLAYPTMQTPNQWPLSPAAPQSASSQLLMITSQLVGLRQAWDRFNEEGTNQVQDIHDILARAYSLDANLEAWKYALPEHWKPLPAVRVPQSVREAGMYKNRCDCYTDLWMAGTWNFYRDSRIVVQNIILRCLQILPDGVMLEQMQETINLIETLALDICATVPYILGSQTMSVHFSPQKIEYPEADGRRVTTAHYPTAALVGGWMVSSHLSNLELLCLSEEMNTWIRAQKERVLQIYTFGGEASQISM